MSLASSGGDAGSEPLLQQHIKAWRKRPFASSGSNRKSSDARKSFTFNRNQKYLSFFFIVHFPSGIWGLRSR